jgi:hypothetical protein
MKKLLPILLVFVSSLIACEKPESDKPYVPVTRCSDMTRNIDTINKYIRGNWEWVESYEITRTFRGYITPNTPGQDRRMLKIDGDSLQFIKNNKPDSIYRFRIHKYSDFSNYPDDSTISVISYTSRYTGMGGGAIVLKICKEQLLMQSGYVSSLDIESLWLRK